MTGDLGGLRADGALEFLRASEIVRSRSAASGSSSATSRTRLRADPEIDDAVVVARDAPSGAKRLVAYLKPHRVVADLPARARQADAALDTSAPETA